MKQWSRDKKQTDCLFVIDSVRMQIILIPIKSREITSKFLKLILSSKC